MAVAEAIYTAAGLTHAEGDAVHKSLSQLNNFPTTDLPGLDWVYLPVPKPDRQVYERLQ